MQTLSIGFRNIEQENIYEVRSTNLRKTDLFKGIQGQNLQPPVRGRVSSLPNSPTAVQRRYYSCDDHTSRSRTDKHIVSLGHPIPATWRRATVSTPKYLLRSASFPTRQGEGIIAALPDTVNPGFPGSGKKTLRCGCVFNYLTLDRGESHNRSRSKEGNEVPQQRLNR